MAILSQLGPKIALISCGVIYAPWLLNILPLVMLFDFLISILVLMIIDFCETRSIPKTWPHFCLKYLNDSTGANLFSTALYGKSVLKRSFLYLLSGLFYVVVTITLMLLTENKEMIEFLRNDSKWMRIILGFVIGDWIHQLFSLFFYRVKLFKIHTS